jgi:hypothetical protein
VALRGVIKDTVQRGTIYTKSSQICAYAEYIVIIATSREKIIEIYMEMEEKAGKIELEVNERKNICQHQNAEGSRKS